MTTHDPAARPRRSNHGLLLLVIAYIGFISLGLPDAVTGVAWPEMRGHFQLPQVALSSVSLALGTGYFLSSFFSGQLSSRLGIGLLLASSSLLVALAMFGNSLAPWFALILVCIFCWGLGSGAIDSGLNHYAASHFSPVHMNWLHACYSLGATIGPFLMTGALTFAHSWRLGYALVGSIVLALTLVFATTLRWWNDNSSHKSITETSPVSMRETLRQRLVWLQIVTFALYTGLEFMVGAWTKTLLIESRGVETPLAGILVGVYFGAIGVGRVVLGGLTHWIGVDRMLRCCTIAAVSGTLLLAVAPSLPMTIAGLVILGIALAPIFPGLMSRTPARLGANHAAHAIGFQVSAATIGGAAIPAFAGLLAQFVSLEAITQFAVLLAALILLLHEAILRFAPTAKTTATTA